MNNENISKFKAENETVKNLVEISIEDAVRINRILDSIYLKTKKKCTKKQFFQKAILEAIKKYERELLFKGL